jgi:hypothetical protein
MKAVGFLILTLVAITARGQEYARILDQTTTYRIFDNQKAEVEERIKILISSEHASRWTVFSEYVDRFRKIDNVSLEIFDKDGKKVKRLKKVDGHEYGFSDSYEITDAKVFVLPADYEQYPYTLEIVSKISYNGFISLPTWVPRPYFNIAVDRASLILSRDQSVILKLKEEFVTGKTEKIENNLVTTYEVTKLPHVDMKMRYQDFYELQPKVSISPEKFKLDNVMGSITSWKSFGDWFLGLNEKPYQLTETTKKFLDSLDKRDHQALIRNVYRYMQDKTRYVSIQLGIGGFQSLPTELVESKGYGDCKALTTYTKNMLDYAGLKSNYVLVRAGDDVPDVMADFPSNQFNHVFLAIPLKDDTVMLECTSQTSPFNYVGSFTDDRNVLWIKQNTSQIIRSRIYNHLQNLQHNEAKIRVNEQGNGIVELTETNKGLFFDQIMMFQGAPTDYVKHYNQEKFEYADFAIKDFKFEQKSRDESAFKTKYTIEVNNLARPAGTKLIFPIIPTTPAAKYVERDDLMKFVSIRRGISIVDEMEITLPENFWISNLPAAEEINSPYGTYTLSTTFDGTTLKIKRSMTFFKGDYKKDKYDAFHVFFDKIVKLEGKKLILNSKT